MSTVRKALNRAATLITRVLVDRSSDTGKVPPVQVNRYGKPAVVEHLQPQGLYFRAPIGAEGVMLAPAGSTSNAVLLAAVDRDQWPAGGDIADGEGGLHYLGSWKVYLDKDGITHLGSNAGETEASRDDKVQDELKAIRDTLNDLITAYNAHIHTTTAVVATGGATGVISPTASTATAPAAVGETKSTTVKLT